jgi:hypothetical protein
MSRSLHTEPYPLRAARRSHDVHVRVSRARPGFTHPAGASDVRRALAFFGPTATYGLSRVELRHGAGRPLVAALAEPGVVVLYEQPCPPWTIRGRLTAETQRRLRRAGATIDVGATATHVDWPGRTLRDFMLLDGLMHEIGHHVVQHRARKQRPTMRTVDHERRADAFAAACRLAWTMTA